MTKKNLTTRSNDEVVPIRAYIAGVMFDNRDANVLELHLGDSLSLVRQPDNSHDVNAIRVLSPDEKEIGFVHRQMATWLAPFIDAQKKQLVATVTELQVPQTWLDLSPQKAIATQQKSEC